MLKWHFAAEFCPPTGQTISGLGLEFSYVNYPPPEEAGTCKSPS